MKLVMCCDESNSVYIMVMVNGGCERKRLCATVLKRKVVEDYSCDDYTVVKVVVVSDGIWWLA